MPDPARLPAPLPRAVQEPTPCVTTPEGRPVWYPPDAALTEAEAADVLNMESRTVRELPLPWCYASDRKKLVFFRDIVKFLESRRVA